MADWSDPKRLTAEELERFLLDRRLREEVGFMFNDGQGAVDDVLREAARRLKQSSATEGER